VVYLASSAARSVVDRAAAHELLNVGIPRDGGMADLLAEAASPAPGSPP